MRYVALLRGINVGGKNIISMAELKAAFEENGFTNVTTYINSGNVLFETEEKNVNRLTEKLEGMLSTRFSYQARLGLRTYKQMQQIVDNVPTEWEKNNDIRCYVAFVKEPLTPEKVLSEVTLKEGVDFIKIGEGVLYMTTKLSGLTKSGFTKLIGKKIYQGMTIRNYTTVKKLLSLMEK